MSGISKTEREHDGEPACADAYNRIIVDSSRDCIKILDLEGNLLMLTEGSKKLLCLDDVAKYLGTSWFDFWEGNDRDAARAAVEAAVAGGSGCFVGLFTTGAGEAKWWDVLVTPVRDESGAVHRLLAVSRDVTERRRSELSAGLISSISDAVLHLTTVNEIMLAAGAIIGGYLGLSNCAFVEIHDEADELEVTHEWLADGVPPSVGRYRLSEDFTEDFRKAGRTGETLVVCDSAADLRAPSGKFSALKFSSFISVPLVREGRWRYSLSLFRAEPHDWRRDEIELAREFAARVFSHVERVRAEIALHESEARFRYVADAAPVLIWISDTTGKGVWFNKPWLDFTGRTLEQELGDGWTEGIHPEDLAGLREAYSTASGQRTPFTKEYRMRHAEGEYRWLLDNGVPRYGLNGGFLGYIGSCVDITGRRQSEEARARLAAIVEFSEDAILSKNTDGVITSWNSSAQRLFGYTADEMVGKSVTLLMPPDRVDEEPGVLARIRRGESVEHYETVRRRKDGSLIDVSLTVSPIFDPEGHVTGASKIVRDISNLKRADRDLRETKAALEFTLDSAQIGDWDLDLAGNTSRRSLRHDRCFGYQEPIPDEEWGLERMIEHVHPVDRERVASGLRDAIENLHDCHFECRVIWPDGSVHWIILRGSPYLPEGSENVRMLGIVMDVTERWQREAALHASETRFRSAVGIVSSLIWTNNAEGLMEGEQPGWGSFTGQSQAEYEGYGWAQAVHPDDAQPTVAAWQKAVAEKRLFEFEHRVRRHDGEWRVCTIRAVPVLDDEGHIREWVGVHTDITERRRADLNVAFLASISQDLLRLSELDELMRTLCAKLGGHLELSRCTFAEVDEPAAELTVIHDWHRSGEPGLRGIHPLGDHVTPEFRQAARAGEPWIIGDAATDPRLPASVGWPLVRDGEWRFLLSIHHSEPHDWRDDEIELVRELATRLWTRLERSRAEEALSRAMAASEQQRRLYDTVLSNTPDFVYVFNLDHRFTYANEALLTMWGLTAEEAIDKDWSELGYEPWHAEMHDREIDHVIATKKPIRGEVPFTGTHGRRIYDYIFVPVLNARGEVEAVAGTTRDVTERKQAEAVEAGERTVFERIATGAPLQEILDTLLREIEAQSSDGMRCSILLLDKSGRHLLHGAAPSLPDAYIEAVHGLPIGPNAGSCGIAAFLGETVLVTDIANDPRWENYKHLAATHGLAACCSTPIFSLQGDILGTAAMYYSQPRDPGEHDLLLIQRATKLAAIIIERKQSEDSLTERTAELVRADRNKDEFLAMLAHELRNPLAPMRNAAEILQAADATIDERDQAQRVLGRQIENMSRMIDDLLDVSRITEGKIELRRQPVELLPLLTAVAEAARPGCAANHQELTLSLPDTPIYLSADATRLEQILGNLLGNACKYSGANTRISLSAELGPSNEAVIRVSDDGIGVDPELLPRIFDLFVQSSRTLDRSHGGLGVGLTVARRLVKLHDGTIEARSGGPGQGTEFVIRLPVIAAPAAEPRPVSRDRTVESGLRMLIVDDNEDAAETMAMLQQLRGHQTRTAHTGPDAVSLAAEFLPDVVLLDIGLPGMDGFEVARRIRTIPGMDSALLVAVTGYGTGDDREQTRAAGFDEHLAKPADLALLNKWLGDYTRRAAD